MKRILIAVLMVMLLLGLTSCCKSKKCQPVVRISYMIPEFACPVPTDPMLKAITPEIVADDIMFKKVMGDNLVEMQKALAMWRGVYYECIQAIVKLYRTEGDKINAENAEADKANEVLPQ